LSVAKRTALREGGLSTEHDDNQQKCEINKDCSSQKQCLISRMLKLLDLKNNAISTLPDQSWKRSSRSK